MPRARLNDASKARAAQKAKKNLAKSTSPAPPKSSVSSTLLVPAKTSQGSSSIRVVDKNLPAGLPTLEPSQIESHLPKIDISRYKISDPHKLPDSLPQVSDSQLEKNKTLAKGAMNAQASEIEALKVVEGTFNVIGQQAKTFGSGVKAGIEILKAKGTYLDYLNQEETNNQKSNQLDFNTYKTDREAEISVQDKLTLDEKLRQATIKAEKAKLQSDELDNELAEARKKVGLPG